jgi:hypothetical protein
MDISDWRIKYPYLDKKLKNIKFNGNTAKTKFYN